MAQTHQLLNFEPWLKPPKNEPLSHGSNPHLTCRFSHVSFRSNTSKSIQFYVQHFSSSFASKICINVLNSKSFRQLDSHDLIGCGKTRLSRADNLHRPLIAVRKRLLADIYLSSRHVANLLDLCALLPYD